MESKWQALWSGWESRLRRGWADLELVRAVDGYRLRVPLEAALLDVRRSCACCGAPARVWREASRSWKCGSARVPDLRVALCGRCDRRLLARAAWMVGGALLVVALGFLSTAVLAWGWAWAAAPVFGLGVVPGVALAWVIVVQLPGRRGWGPGRWQGAPARWVGCASDGATLETVSGDVADTVGRSIGATPGRVVLRERDARWVGMATLVTMVVAPFAVWLHSHPRLWVANASADPLEVVVDGRSLGVVVGVPSEAADSVRTFRVPRGWRVLEARRLDGSVVDRTEGSIGGGSAQLYVPARSGSCFWVERRAYGRASQPRPAVVRLAPDRTLYTLPERVDAWFQANPSTGGMDRWFSGGVRRAVRQGRCEGETE